MYRIEYKVRTCSYTFSIVILNKYMYTLLSEIKSLFYSTKIT